MASIHGISFCVEAGEIFGLLGHNGAGKSTTIRMLTGRSKPTSGVTKVAGYDVANEREKIKPFINLVFEDQNLYERLSAVDNLRIFTDLYAEPKGRADEPLKRVGLMGAAGRKVKTYSTGMKQRLLIARALVNRPKVLFLDEPTRGLDPTSARELRELISDLSREGTTVLLTTHYMEEADELCDRTAFLSHLLDAADGSRRRQPPRMGREGPLGQPGKPGHAAHDQRRHRPDGLPQPRALIRGHRRLGSSWVRSPDVEPAPEAGVKI